MVKVRMNTADVAAEVTCLRRLIGMRCANVYDISPKTYLFKLMNSSGITESGESEKVFLLMESGIRLHTTAYARLEEKQRAEKRERESKGDQFTPRWFDITGEVAPTPWVWSNMDTGAAVWSNMDRSIGATL